MTRTHGNTGNAHARKHGLRATRTGNTYVDRQLRALDNLCRGEIAGPDGSISAAQVLALQAIRRHETPALLAGAYLRDEKDLPLADRLRLLDIIRTATEARDRALRQLGIGLEDGKPSSGSIWDALKSPQSFSNATSTETAPSAGPAIQTPQATVPTFDPRPFPAPGEDQHQPGISEVTR